MKQPKVAAFAATLLLVSHAAAQYKVLIPQCCTASAAVFALNPKTGEVQLSITTATSSSSFVLASVAAPLKDGGLAVFNTLLGSEGLSSSVSVVNPSSGALLVESVAVPGEPWGLAVNPQSGVIYAASAFEGVYTIVELNPSTLEVIRQFAPASGNSIVVSHDGKRIYIPTFGTGVNVYSTSSLTQIGNIPGPDLVLGISPDNKTLYAASDLNGAPQNSVFFVDTENFGIAKTISVGSFGTVSTGQGQGYSGGVLSPDGKQLYVNFSSSILAINVTTLVEVNTPYPAGDAGQELLAPAAGSVTVSTLNNGTSVALIFDPDSQTFPAQFPVAGQGTLVSSASGAQLFALASGSPLAVPGPAPSTTIVSAGLAGPGAGYLYGTYDAKDDLLLLPDSDGTLEILDAATLQLKSLLPIGASGPVTYSNAAYMSYFTYIGTPVGHVVQFDPVTLKVTGALPVPTYAGDNAAQFSQLTAVGNFLYAPYYSAFADCCDSKTPEQAFEGNGSALEVIDTTTFKVSAVYPISLDLVAGFAVPAGSQYGYFSVTPGELGDLVKMDLATGVEVGRAPLPAYGSLLASTDGATLYIYGAYQLYAIDVATLAVTTSSPLFCTGLAATPDGAYLYCSTTGGVDILSTSSLDVVGLIPAATDGINPGPAIVLAK